MIPLPPEFVAAAAALVAWGRAEAGAMWPIADGADASWQDQLHRYRELLEQAIEQFALWLRATIGPPLKSIHQPVDQWLGSLPMWVATASVVALYAIAVIWVWTLRREFVFRGAPDRRGWRDLRIWATLIVVPYVAIYLVLGR